MRLIIGNAMKQKNRKGLLFKSKRAGEISKSCGLVIVLMTYLLLIFIPRDVNAQTGSIYGEISDASTGESLPGATIVLQGTTQGTTSDIDGRYLLRRVPVGEYVVVFSYMGYESQEIPVTVGADERVMQNVDLQDIMIMGDDVLVTARQRGQARALTRQRESVSIRNIVSAEQMDAFADQTVTGSLSRIVGMGHGGANIRGVGPGASNITMDGQRMGTTSRERQVDLGTISSDMVQELEVIKVITPDMDAESLSGVINVSTRRPIGGERSMNIRLGGGMQDRYLRHTGAATRFSFSYGDSPNERFTYGVNLSHQRAPSAAESINIGWAAQTFDEIGRVDVLSDVRNEFRYDYRDRYAGGFQMTFQPTDRSTFHVQSLLNFQDSETHRHGMRYNINVGRYTTPNQTGPMISNEAAAHTAPRLDEDFTRQSTIQLGGRHLLNLFDVEYVVGWGHGRNYGDTYTYNFSTRGRFEYMTNYEDRRNVEVWVAPWSEWPYNPIPAGLYEFSNLDHRISKHTDNDFTGKLDFVAPYNRGTIKFGSSAIMTFRAGEGERYQGPIDRRLGADEFEWIPNATWNVFDRDHQTYSIPFMLDLQKAKDLYEAWRPHFNMSPDTWVLEVETSQYTAEEHTFGVYAMGDITFSRFTLLGGVRIEHTTNSYDGREGDIGDDGRYLGGRDVSSSTDFTNLFPNAQMVYSIGNMTNLRAAYSRSIGRPNLNQLSPNVTRNYNNETIRKGNPNLKPMLSDNLDVIIEHYFMNVGQLSAGVFYKDLSDFIFTHSERLRFDDPDEDVPVGEDIPEEEDPRYEGWFLTTFRNGQEASVYGIELSWQQNLAFLPGILGNMGIYSNYAYTQSLADIGRRDPNPAIPDTIRVPLLNQRPHVLNAGISYIHGRFNTQITYQWAAPSISSYGSQQWLPEIHQRHREYFDAYNDATNNLSMTFQYRISNNFRIWGDASNILNHRRINYRVDRDFYPTSISLSGRRINMGLRYTF